MHGENVAVTVGDIKAASARLAGQAVETPLVESGRLNALAGGRILLKAECLQRTGSFKFRGAFNRISQLSDMEARHGVIAYSSGHHAQGVACAAALRGLPATIVMPADTPAIKKQNTRGYGAKIVEYDRETENRVEIAQSLARDSGAVVIPPFVDPHVIAGQGTAGLEIVRQCREIGVAPDAVLVCHGGGGLTAGIATAIVDAYPGADIYGVEPEGFDDLGRSLASGRRETNPTESGSICDALLSRSPGEITFGINQRLLKGALSVSDDDVREAIRFAFGTLKLVVEPGGAVALAAILTEKIDCRGRVVAATLSGGNVDPELYAGILTA